MQNDCTRHNQVHFTDIRLLLTPNTTANHAIMYYYYSFIHHIQLLKTMLRTQEWLLSFCDKTHESYQPCIQALNKIASTGQPATKCMPTSCQASVVLQRHQSLQPTALQCQQLNNSSVLLTVKDCYSIQLFTCHLRKRALPPPKN